jgi:hypothetical protein
MTLARLAAVVSMLAAAALALGANAQTFGELKIRYALDGRTETVTPDKIFGREVKTPRKGKPFYYVAWRHDQGDPRDSTFRSALATFNAMVDDEKGYGLGLLLEKDKKALHYASRCSPRTMPKCDPATQGMRHDPVARKITFRNVVFDRVSLQDTSPNDTITVNGELSYAP